MSMGLHWPSEAHPMTLETGDFGGLEAHMYRIYRRHGVRRGPCSGRLSLGVPQVQYDDDHEFRFEPIPGVLIEAGYVAFPEEGGGM